MKIREQYLINKKAKQGSDCICPSCGANFIKDNYQQAFCRSKKGTVCKDKYWNTVTPSKRNNTTRISPANAKWLASRERDKNNFNSDDYEHPFSSESLGQWDD